MQELYATIDLGSNSFHMLTAALEHNEIKILDSISEKVMLAEGLSKIDGIHPDAMQRGLECIDRFAQRLASIPRQNIRIVGTNTLRAAKNADDYVVQLEKRLGGIPIDIVSGIEEARLIYLGVNHSWSSITQHTKNLVTDIGGGSTEFIIGKNFKLKNAESLRMGCVAYRRYFPDELITSPNFQRAVRAAKLELSNIKKDFPNKSWENAVGSAGTFKAIEKILIENQLSDEGITLAGLKKLKSMLLGFKNFNELEIGGLKPLREKTIVPGVAICMAIFQSLGIKHLHISRGGLREGILYDLIGRLKAEDIRQRSIQALCRRYHVSEVKSKLYRKICRKLASNIEQGQDNILSSEHLHFLDWAAQCCRIGLSISHSQYHKHSAYLVEHSELSGFTIKERKILAAIVKNHRRKLCLDIFEQARFNRHQKRAFLTTILILRLTNIIGQNGKNNRSGHIALAIKQDKFDILLDQKWIQKHSLIRKALELETTYWERAGVELTLKASPQ